MQKFTRTFAIIAVPILALVALLALVGAFGAPLGAQTAAAQDTPDMPETRTIRVSGAGRVSARPDLAIVRVGVQTEADTAVAALDANSERMQGVISATLEAGIAEADIQTQGLSLQPVYDRPAEGPAELRGYRARNLVEVRVRDLGILGDVLDTAVAAGGNTIEGIRFEVSDVAALLEQARAAAMNDAIAKAQQLTALADAELGEVLTIVESSRAAPIVEREAAFEAAAAVPVQAGTETIETTVQVSWRIQ